MSPRFRGMVFGRRSARIAFCETPIVDVLRARTERRLTDWVTTRDDDEGEATRKDMSDEQAEKRGRRGGEAQRLEKLFVQSKVVVGGRGRQRPSGEV